MTQTQKSASPVARLFSSPFTTAALAAIGSLLNAYLTHRYFVLRSGDSTEQSICSLNSTFNCDTVAQSQYAELFSGIPISVLATGVMIYIAFLALWPSSNSTQKRASLWTQFIFSLAGVLAGIPLLLAMATKIGSFCIFCLVTDAISLILTLTAWSQLRKQPEAGLPAQETLKKIALAAIPIAIAFVALKPAPDEDEKRREEAAQLIYESLKTAPVAEIKTDNTTLAWGPTHAPIQLVMFGDFQCGHCKKAFFRLKTLKLKYNDQIRWVLKEFPLSPQCNPNLGGGGGDGHPHACILAKGALCAEKEGRYFEYSEEIYRNQETLTSQSAVETAEKLGLNLDQFKKCLDDTEIAKVLSAQIDEGASYKLQATPTIWINGKKTEGALPMSVYTKVIEDELRRVDR